MWMHFASSGNLLADRRFEFAQALAERGELAAAADLMAQTVALSPTFASAWFALGDLQERLGQSAQAESSFREALRHDPADRHGATLRLARLGVAASAMPSAYVETLFDQYAERFDHALVDGLAYRGPALLRAAIERTSPPPRRFAHMLDLGCGTGLAGAAFRDLAERMTGVDLSAGMLAAARAKNLYGDLVQADLATFLAESREIYDLVVAADVFAYLTDLSPVCAAVAGVLSPVGLFGFSVETHAGDGVVLGEKLRYAHGGAHVRTALAAARLAVVEMEPASTRNEAGVPVAGLVVVARPA
jgi:predicted TPR repeat methyltransferase